jgi:hypothetical protein
MHEIIEYYPLAILRDCRANALKNEGCYVSCDDVSNYRETIYKVSATHNDLILQL